MPWHLQVLLGVGLGMGEGEDLGLMPEVLVNKPTISPSGFWVVATEKKTKPVLRRAHASPLLELKVKETLKFPVIPAEDVHASMTELPAQEILPITSCMKK
jgi:hypothetical protein